LVEGSFATRSDYRHRHTIQIAKNIARRNSKRRKPTLLHLPVALAVMCNLMWRVVKRSIDFDCEALAQAGEIEAILTDRVLTAEFEPAGTRPERLPQADLGRVS